MGSSCSKKMETNSSSNSSNPATNQKIVTNSQEEQKQQDGLETFVLKHPGSCSGMFWRGDPRPNSTSNKAPKAASANWPRNGSLLTGTVHTDLPDMKWLEVDSWKPAGKDKWITQCQGLWMPFEQHGLLLHKQN